MGEEIRLQAEEKKEEVVPVEEVWYDDRNKLYELCQHLVDEEGYNAENLLEIIEKPWKWTPEWDEYEKRPHE